MPKFLMRAISFVLVIALSVTMFVPTAEATTYYVIDNTPPFTGEAFVAVNVTESGFFSSIGSTTITAPQYTTYSNKADEPIPDNIIGYDDNGIPLLDPNDILVQPTPPEVNPDISGNTISKTYVIGEEKSFRVLISGNSPDTNIQFHVVSIGEHCVVWTPVSGYEPINASEGKILADEFDAQYDTMVAAFNDPMSENYTYSDPDNDGKVAIVCYDIHNNGTGTGSYVAGYHYTGDYYSGGNRTDSIYIDSAQGMLNGADQAFGTMIHEFQHMINFVSCGYTTSMPTSINEGMSMAAEMMIYEGTEHAPMDRVTYFNSLANLYAFSATNWAGSLPNYSLSFLLFQYLRTQYKNPDSTDPTEQNGTSIFKTILNMRENVSTTYGYFNEVAKLINFDIETLITNFYIALYLKEDTGIYGFDGETWADSIVPVKYNTSTPPNIVSGGAVFYGAHTEYNPTATNANAKVIFNSISQITANNKVSVTVQSYDTKKDFTLTLTPKSGGSNIVENIPGTSGENPRQLSITAPSGEYDLSIDQEGHTSAVIYNINVTSSVNLSQTQSVGTVVLTPGDVDANGIVNQSDIEYIMDSQIYNRSILSVANKNADVNGDGKVDFDDGVLIRNAQNFGKGTKHIYY